MASRRKRGPVAFRHRLWTGLALSLMCTKRSTNRQIFQSVGLIQPLFRQSAMSGLGQKQPLMSLAAQRLLSASSGHKQNLLSYLFC